MDHSKLSKFISDVFPNKSQSLLLAKVFFGSIIFAFCVSMPVFYYLSKDIGVVLIFVNLGIFFAIDAYIIVKIINYSVKKKIGK